MRHVIHPHVGVGIFTFSLFSLSARTAYLHGFEYQGNVYFLKTASTMAVIDFPEACAIGTFWIYTVSFIIIASLGLAMNALAMQHYKATFCVCSFVGTSSLLD